MNEQKKALIGVIISSIVTGAGIPMTLYYLKKIIDKKKEA